MRRIIPGWYEVLNSRFLYISYWPGSGNEWGAEKYEGRLRWYFWVGKFTVMVRL